MTLDQRTAQMFSALKQDWKDATDPVKNPSRNVEHINLEAYKLKFDICDQDIQAYCDTLTPMRLIHPVCVMCGAPWYRDEREVKPIGNGQAIRGVDYIETFCSSEDDDHDTFWYYQASDGNCSFERAIDNLNGNNFSLHWNCNCDVPECYERNHIVHFTGSYRAGTEKITTIKYFDPPLPYNISHEELWDKIAGIMTLL